MLNDDTQYNQYTFYTLHEIIIQAWKQYLMLFLFTTVNIFDELPNIFDWRIPYQNSIITNSTIFLLKRIQCMVGERIFVEQKGLQNTFCSQKKSKESWNNLKPVTLYGFVTAQNKTKANMREVLFKYMIKDQS